MFDGEAPEGALHTPGIVRVRRQGRVLSVLSSAGAEPVLEEARTLGSGGLLPNGPDGALFTLSLPASREQILGVHVGIGLASDIWRPLLIACLIAVVLSMGELLLPALSRYGIVTAMSGGPYPGKGAWPWPGLFISIAASIAMLSAAFSNFVRTEF